MPRCRMDSFCLPVAGWPLAGASFLFLRAGVATTKFSPYHQQTATHLPAPWLLVALSLFGFLYYGRGLIEDPASFRPTTVLRPASTEPHPPAAIDPDVH